MRLSDWSRTFPFFIYRKLTFTIPIIETSYIINDGYIYLLNTISAKYPTAGSGAPSGVSLELYFGERGTVLQNIAVPIPLISTPGEVTGNQAGNLTSLYRFDYLYLNSGIIQLVFRQDGGGVPSQIEVCIQGQQIEYHKNLIVD